MIVFRVNPVSGVSDPVCTRHDLKHNDSSPNNEQRKCSALRSRWWRAWRTGFAGDVVEHRVFARPSAQCESGREQDPRVHSRKLLEFFKLLHGANIERRLQTLNAVMTTDDIDDSSTRAIDLLHRACDASSASARSDLRKARCAARLVWVS